MGQRGRKKGSNGEASRALLLRIATEEFASKGYYETKVSSIVKKAKVTQPTFYLYFQSKEALFQELVDSFRDSLFGLINNSRLEAGIVESDLPNEIRRGLRAIFDFFESNLSLTRIGLYLAADAEDIKRELANQIKENLDTEVKNGYFSSSLDTRIFAESLVGAMERLTITLLHEGLANAEDLADQLVTLFLFGLQNKKV
ncbi:TetR/AcrR family transcriptional regulator [Aquibacillus salsiterrae]|uniref:TetR/AcrR family transcriptional regulator n=1 Tax=Aquibacillus salsiterrae TaxID=2950439 RepID=A0A9X4AHL1_9BACI|nr:TetR/AcrR family transcriptional regulator [Aquibacillus salsiterrae]MDC3418328.1 TetR/AcrR family transcriptional regulator [Aquibacillus salsiterrae]